MRLHQHRANELIQPGVISSDHGLAVVRFAQLLGQRGGNLGEPSLHATVNSHLSADQCAGTGSDLGIQGPGVAARNLDLSNKRGNLTADRSSTTLFDRLAVGA